jgi:predicted ATPase
VDTSPGTGRHALPLIGRSAELDDLDDLVSSAASGTGGVLVVEGEAGVGRTSLVEALVPGTSLLGMDVVVVQAHADDEPLAPLLAAMPEGSGGGWSADPDGVARALRGRGESAPWVLVLDDLHRADDETIDTVTRMAGDGPLPGCALVVTLRPVPPRAAVQTLITAWVRAGARNVELRPLDPASALALAEREAGGKIGPALRGAVSTAGGNPRLVVAVVRAAREADALAEVAPGTFDVADLAWQADLADAAHAQVTEVDDEVVDLLRAAAVLGPSFVVPDLAVLVALPVADCWRRLRHALAAGVVSARGDRLVFRHPLVRTALYDDLDPETRRALHGRAAATLAAAGAPAQVVAGHLERASGADPS